HQVRDVEDARAHKVCHAGASLAGIGKAKGGELAAGGLAEAATEETERQRLEHLERRHAALGEAVADLIGHLPAQFAYDVSHLAALSRLDAIEEYGEMVGEDRPSSTAPPRVMRHGHEVSGLLIATAHREGMHGPQRARQVEVAAPKASAQALAALIDESSFLAAERNKAVMVSA